MIKSELELTIKAIIIGTILAIVLCGANIYLGLKIGSTISASVPASIMAMGILRFFKNYSVLENSIAQTIASAGEAIASVVIFIFPALLILGTWKEIAYFPTFMMCLCGGIVGIVFSVILRKILLKDKSLTFPEGLAIGQVLLTTNNPKASKGGIIAITVGMVLSATINFLQTGLEVLAGNFYKVFRSGNSVFGLGTSFSTAIIGAGYLVGFNPGMVSLIALIFAWGILLPIFSSIHGIHDTSDLVGSAFFTWKHYIRPIGIGVLIFSGVATITSLMKPIIHGVHDSFNALKNIRGIDQADKDLNLKSLLIWLVLACIPIFIFIFIQLAKLSAFGVAINLILTILIMAIVLFLGFIISSVAGYFAGFIGSTNSPNSGLSYIAVIALTIILQLIIGHKVAGTQLAELYSTIILVVAFIFASTTITNDNIQDYKSGQIVGATPYKQQISLFFGVVASALVSPLLINLIFNAYGIAGIIPHPGIDPNNTLSAPQASAIASITKHIIYQTQDWSLIAYGILIGFVSLIIDMFAKRSKYHFRFPILSVGIAIYLPPDIVAGLFLGGLLRLLVTLKHNKLENNREINSEELYLMKQKTNLLVCGLVAGESLMGIILAIPFVIKQSSDALSIVGSGFKSTSEVLSFVVTLAVLYFVYKFSQTRIKQ